MIHRQLGMIAPQVQPEGFLDMSAAAAAARLFFKFSLYLSVFNSLL